MEQHAVDRLRVMLHARDRRIAARSGDAELRWRRLDAIAVTRPHDDARIRLEARKEALVLLHADLGSAVLALRGRSRLAAREMGDQLHPIADAKYRNAELEDLGVDGGSTGLEYRVGSAGQNDALGIERPNEIELHALGSWMNLAVDAGLTNAPRDELREL